MTTQNIPIPSSPHAQELDEHYWQVKRLEREYNDLESIESIIYKEIVRKMLENIDRYYTFACRVKEIVMSIAKLKNIQPPDVINVSIDLRDVVYITRICGKPRLVKCDVVNTSIKISKKYNVSIILSVFEVDIDKIINMLLRLYKARMELELDIAKVRPDALVEVFGFTEDNLIDLANFALCKDVIVDVVKKLVEREMPVIESAIQEKKNMLKYVRDRVGTGI